VTRLQQLLVRLAPILLLVGAALVVAACAPSTQTTGSDAAPSFTQAPLAPAQLTANPMDALAWMFTPIFQLLFIILVALDRLTGNMLFAIVLLTVILVGTTTPIIRKQLVSSRQMQLLLPEVKEIQRRFKGEPAKAQAAVQEFYKQRGVSQFGGCLPTILTMGLLIPMYSVFSQGLTNYHITAMLQVGPIDFGQMLGVSCSAAAPIFDAFGHVRNPCLDSMSFGIDWGIPEPFTTGLFIGEFGKSFGISILALGSALVQLVSSRQSLPPHDPRTADDANTRVQKQMALILPFLSLLYGGIVPAGLMLYWIASAILRTGQQFLVFGFGGIFPIFGWSPAFARDYTPRYHVTIPEPTAITTTGKSTGAAERSKALDRDLSAQSTIRPNRARSGRRGRRR
jgi:YidC/Oxa1 family membrane protein insertase